MSDNLHLQAIFGNADRAGLYHLPHIDKAEVLAAAQAAGLTTFRVSLAQAGNKAQMLTAIAQALNFPESFGHNFDALADCLTDMAWQPADGYLVLLEHCDGIHSKAETDFRTALRIFAQAATDWQEQDFPFWCLVEIQADGTA
jgi:RNAse (barnase) inhibitor barstar